MSAPAPAPTVGANKLRGEIVARIAGQDRVLRMGAAQLVALQDFLGKGPLRLVEPGQLDYKEAIACIHFGIIGGGVPEQTYERTLALVDGEPMAEVTGAALALLFAAMGLMQGSEKKKGEAKAPKR